MTKLKQFEDLECWEKARGFTFKIYSITKNNFKKDFRLIDHITGAALSIMNNISEGFDSQSNAEFIRFLTYSRRSCSEVQNCLYVALDQDYINESEFRDLYESGSKIRQLIDGFIRYLKSCKKKRT
jgi:four helix bundle protein